MMSPIALTRGAPIWIFTDVPITDISITKITDADIYFMLQSSQNIFTKCLLEIYWFHIVAFLKTVLLE